MSDAGTTAAPNISVVNDLYWLKWASDSVGTADDTRRASAEKLIGAVGWFWTVYVAVAVAGVAFADRDFSLPVALVVLLPVASLVLAYLLALWVTVPVVLAYDARNPSEIRAAYLTVMTEQGGRAKWALGATIASGILVVVAGATVTATQPGRGPAFQATYATSAEGRGVLVTSGQFDKNETVTLRLTPVGTQGEAEVTVLETASRTGRLRATVPVPAGTASAYDVTASWRADDAAQHAITRNVKLDQSGQ